MSFWENCPIWSRGGSCSKRLNLDRSKTFSYYLHFLECYLRMHSFNLIETYILISTIHNSMTELILMDLKLNGRPEQTKPSTYNILCAHILDPGLYRRTAMNIQIWIACVLRLISLWFAEFNNVNLNEDHESV